MRIDSKCSSLELEPYCSLQYGTCMEILQNGANDDAGRTSQSFAWQATTQALYDTIHCIVLPSFIISKFKILTIHYHIIIIPAHSRWLLVGVFLVRLPYAWPSWIMCKVSAPPPNLQTSRTSKEVECRKPATSWWKPNDIIIIIIIIVASSCL